MKAKFFQTIRELKTQISSLEVALKKITLSQQNEIDCLKNYLLRLKNDEKFLDEDLIYQRPYRDYSPKMAYEFIQQGNRLFYVIDISPKNYLFHGKIPGSLSATFDQETHILFWDEKPAPKNAHLFVISEDGVKSILVCEKLSQLGYIQINHISGGHHFWPGHGESEALKDFT
jgi:hypothetical protein